MRFIRMISRIVVMIFVALSLAACSESEEPPSGPFVFERLESGGCDGTVLDYRKSLQRVIETVGGSSFDDAALQHFREIRCLSARDFKAAHSLMLDSIPDSGPRSEYAPLVFVYFDMGARLIDDRTRQWLVEWSRDKDSDENVDHSALLATRGPNLLSIPTSITPAILHSLPGATWDGRCNYASMSWSSGVPYCATEEVCPLLRQSLDTELLASADSTEWNDLCEQLCRSLNTGEEDTAIDPELQALCGAESGGQVELPEPTRAGMLRCLDTYIDQTRRDDGLMACIIARPHPLELPWSQPGTHVVISDRCMLANVPPPPGPEDKIEELEERKKELEEERKRLSKEYMKYLDEKGDLEPFPHTSEWYERKAVTDAYLDNMKRNREEKEEIDREIKRLKDEIEKEEKYGVRRCSQDDFSCADGLFHPGSAAAGNV